MVAARINVCTLLVHHVVIFEKAFADAEVVFLNSLLGVLDGAVDHLRLDHLAFLNSEFVEHLHDLVGNEETHQLIFEREIEHG